MVSVVVPIYNEEELILRFHEAVANALNSVGGDWEVVYVNDGSKDSSLDLLKGLQSEDPRVVVVELSRNWGHMGAIAAGLQTARGRAVILMDGDFQDPPEVLPQLIDAWRDGAEVVVLPERDAGLINGKRVGAFHAQRFGGEYYLPGRGLARLRLHL